MAIRQNPLGATDLIVSDLCIGTSPLAGMSEIYGYGVDDAVAGETLDAVLASEITFIDTSNNYGDGRAERRIGSAIARAGGLPAGVVVASKADPPPDRRDFSGDRVRRSLEESLERLGLERLDLFYLHDPENYPFAEMNAPGAAVDTMVALREEGLVGHIGVAGGDIEAMGQYVRTGAFEVLLNHNNYTLVDQSADALIDLAVELGVAFVNAAPFGGGMLTPAPGRPVKYRYAAAPPQLVERVERLQVSCEAFGVPLAAAALQFSTRDPRIVSTVVGISRPERVDELLAFHDLVVPSDLWDELREGSK